MIKKNQQGKIIRVRDSDHLEIDCHDVARIIEELWGDRPVTIDFVPFSQSRNAKEKQKSLNYKIHICGMIIDYSMGVAHCQAYKSKWVDKKTIIDSECENGHPNGYYRYNTIKGKPKTLPRVGDVIHCIVRDCDVLETNGFEDFCATYGYDTDSRKAYEIFNLIVNNSLRFKNSIPNELFESLRVVSRFN
jgi:hypothetical protein